VSTPSLEITRLLRAWGAGDREALDKLTPVVYQELRRIARGYMRRENAGHTLQTTALVNEAYLRLVDAPNIGFQDRAHFFALSAQMMRRILVDSARARVSRKRGGGMPRANLDNIPDVSSGRDRELVAVDDALNALAELDARKARIIEMRFFGGLNVEEIAGAMKMSTRSVERDLSLAKAWLMRELSAT
jgi:RNA polymerase sigma-70 factor (ECF subfamily)